MEKNRFFSITIFSVIITFIFLIGCGKTDKNVTTDKKTEKKETLDTSKFYTSSDSKYWQNYSGKTPSGDAEMTEVKDPTQIEKIKKEISGETTVDVYTCEMHPQVHQNYDGKCPLCKMDLIKQEKKSSTVHMKSHEELDAMWQGKPNAIHKELKVPDAKCDNYKKIIEDVLSNDKGVLDEVVDTKEHIVHMYLDKTKTNVENVEKLIQTAGFDVGDKKANPEAKKKLPECGK